MITIKNPIDMHIHLREGAILRDIINFSAKYFVAALVMPNLKEPITNTKKALNYKKEIKDSIKGAKDANFVPIMSIYLNENLNKNELSIAKKEGIKILKLYPKGATTGSERGVSEILNNNTLEIFEIAQNLGFILSIHGESNGFCMDREFEFGEIFKEIALNFPKLKIIMEHLSDKRSIKLLENHKNLFATLTLHHITMTLDDVIGGGLNPHHFCKPILKSPKDRDALLDLALNANPKVSFGGDSAPHLESNKLKQNGAAGIFSGPILIPYLCEIFEKHKKLENLQNFISNNAIKIYNLENLPQKNIILVKENFKVPNEIKSNNENIIPLFANKNISWKIKETQKVKLNNCNV